MMALIMTSWSADDRARLGTDATAPGPAAAKPGIA